MAKGAKISRLRIFSLLTDLAPTTLFTFPHTGRRNVLSWEKLFFFLHKIENLPISWDFRTPPMRSFLWTSNTYYVRLARTEQRNDCSTDPGTMRNAPSFACRRQTAIQRIRIELTEPFISVHWTGCLRIINVKSMSNVYTTMQRRQFQCHSLIVQVKRVIESGRV